MALLTFGSLWDLRRSSSSLCRGWNIALFAAIVFRWQILIFGTVDHTLRLCSKGLKVQLSYDVTHNRVTSLLVPTMCYKKGGRLLSSFSRASILSEKNWGAKKNRKSSAATVATLASRRERRRKRENYIYTSYISMLFLPGELVKKSQLSSGKGKSRQKVKARQHWSEGKYQKFTRENCVLQSAIVLCTTTTEASGQTEELSFKLNTNSTPYKLIEGKWLQRLTCL